MTTPDAYDQTSLSGTKGCYRMYLTIKQHDMFRTLLMGFEIPFRAYIADVVTSSYSTDSNFETVMLQKYSILSPSSPQFLRDVLSKAISKHTLKSTFHKFETAITSVDEIVTSDIDLPMVGALNLATFALTENFGNLYSLFGSYATFCDLAEKYRYSRNKLDHPGCRTLEDSHLIPVLSFVKDICIYLDEKYFLQKSKDTILSEITALQQRKVIIPIEKNNFAEMPYGESRVVCRDNEIERIKNFVYGKPDDLRKQHSFCVYGYGGVGKTALVLEALKQIVRDVQDGTTTNEYQPKYILFFSAKQRKLNIASETGKLIEQKVKCHFETADELIESLYFELGVESLRKFKQDGIIVVDNLETLSLEERDKIKNFIDCQTPSEMQFILTSRNSEEYETNFKLAGFDVSTGMDFIFSYNEENSLGLYLSEEDRKQLLDLAKGNTLVLVLSLRRLSNRLASLATIKTEFSAVNAWKSLRTTLASTPSNAYEVVSEFMYKDTFEHIEKIFSNGNELFYKVLKVFAVIENNSTDINTICLLTEESYPDVEQVIDILCNYLIIEKRDMQYSLNSFAEKYIVGRFIPDAETYSKLSTEITNRRRQVQFSLTKLEEDIKSSSTLAKIMSDWQIISDIDRITAAKMYQMYGEVKKECDFSGKYRITAALEESLKSCNESESVTAHPYIKYQRARILQLVDKAEILDKKHTEDIKKAYYDSIYAIKTIEQYSNIQQTKSYASLLWLFGQYLSEEGELLEGIRYLEESKISFEEQAISDQEYYQCSAKLATIYLNYYEADKKNRITYLRKSRMLVNALSKNWDYLGKARKYVSQLKTRLNAYGTV